MSFDPQSVRGGSPLGDLPGQIDYRLARNSVISEFRKGRLSRLDVCDAQAELLRAAQNVGEPTGETCPICEEAALVHVSYAFGPRLPPSGTCVSSRRELVRLTRSTAQVACYVVEVCPDCRWNHLAKTFVVGGQRARTS
ncbi:MAG TPA: DUF5318 family protein [Acidimicrobiales bacterium]